MSKTQTIYRVENYNGEGPYTADDISIERLKMIDNHNNIEDIYPTPDLDEGIGRPIQDSEELCGFDSMLQLTDWFCKEELDMLADDGFFIVEVRKAHITAQSNCQILFIRDEVWQYRNDGSNQKIWALKNKEFNN